MYKINDCVVYKKDVCKIVDITKKSDNREYYNLVPISDDSLKIDVPTENNQNLIRNLVSEKEIHKTMDKIDDIPILTSSSNALDNDYKILLRDGSMKSLMTIIKTAVLRNNKREACNKKKSDRDMYYLALAEKYLYTEISIVLKMTVEEVKEFIMDSILKKV